MDTWPDVTRTKKQAAGSDSIVIMLSLNLIVLAFFMLLNSLATVTDEKANLAARSVKNSTSEQQDALANQNNSQNSTNQRMQAARQQAAVRMRGVMSNIVKPEDVLMPEAATYVQVSLPIEAVFAPQSITPLAAGVATLTNVAALAGGTPRLEISINLLAPTLNDELARRTVALQQALVAQGQALTVGFMEGECAPNPHRPAKFKQLA
jgi:hypothetical protein